MTIVVVGILAVMAAPRFVSWTGFASRGFYDEAQGVVRLAQKTAIAWRRTIFVCVSATAVSAESCCGENVGMAALGRLPAN